MQRGGLFSAASWSLTGQVGYYGLQWVNMIILARLSGPEAVGLYTLGLALANPIMTVASLMLRLVYVTDQEDRWRFEDYNAVKWIALPLGVLAVVAAGLMLGYQDIALIIIMLAASWKMAEMMSEINYAIPHKKGDMRAIAQSMILRAAISSAVLALVLYITDRLDFSLAAFTLTWWICFLTYDRGFARNAPEVTPKETRLKLVRFSMPMALSAAVVLLTFSVPRIVLDQYEDTATLGVFAAISHLLLIGALAVNSLGAAVTPRLSRFFAAGDMASYYKEILFSIGAAVFVSLAFITVAYFFGERLITILYGNEIGMNGDLIFKMSIASLSVYVGSIIGFVPPALQAYRFHLAVNIITVLGTAAAAFYFIPTHGVEGAVFAVFIQGSLQLLNALILLRQPKREAHTPAPETSSLQNAS